MKKRYVLNSHVSLSLSHETVEGDRNFNIEDEEEEKFNDSSFDLNPHALSINDIQEKNNFGFKRLENKHSERVMMSYNSQDLFG